VRKLKLAVVADDNRISRMILREILEQQGAEVLEAANGDEAYELVTARGPDLVISDLLMPGCDGFELATRLHEAALEHRPVLFLTTAVYKDRKWRHEAHTTYRADEFLPKPVDGETLLRALEKYFELPSS
jgi:CheY-like chemotaxis protein